MSVIQDVVNKYFDKYPIDVEKAKEDFINQNKFKFLDKTDSNKYTWGIELEKLYIEKLKIK
jgi:hypothetical protein